MLTKLTKKQNINFFMSSVLFTVLTLPLNMIHLWTKLKWKIQQVFLLPSRFCVLIWHLGESLYPTIPKNKTSEGSSLSKQTKLIIYYCEILSIKWTFSKSSYILICMFWYMNYSSINCFIYRSIQIKRIKFTFTGIIIKVLIASYIPFQLTRKSRRIIFGYW